MTDVEKQKSGYAVMVGRSNVGKSTLLNALVGSKVAITSPKAQTTRMPVTGILNRPEGQVVFIDTPGVFQKRRDALTKKLLHSVKESLKAVDVIIYVADPTRAIGDEERQVLRMVRAVDAPKIYVINKTDLYEPKYLADYRDIADDEGFDEVVELSARTGAHIGSLVQAIYEHLPEGEPFFEDQQLSDMPSEQWIAELIREKLFLRLREEAPYTTHVEVEDIEARENGALYITGTIYVASDRYKGMVVGKGGRGIKEVGQSARKELEVVLNAPVYLELDVAVDPHWVRKLG